MSPVVTVVRYCSRDIDIGKVKTENDSISIPGDPSTALLRPALLRPSRLLPSAGQLAVHLSSVSDFVGARKNVMCMESRSVSPLGTGPLHGASFSGVIQGVAFVAQEVPVVWMHPGLTFRPFAGVWGFSGLGL